MKSKLKARKLASAQEKGIAKGADGVPVVPGYFPFTNYTSVVGVHSTLLAFTTLFLPRTTELIQFLDPSSVTSKDRPQHPFLDALTLSPVSTLVCICVGAVILQSWWGGWLRAWYIDFALQGTGLEHQIDRARVDTRKFTNMGNAWLTTAVASVLFHIILILFSAPLTSHIWQTYLLALLLSILTVFPPAYTLGSPLFTSAPTTWMSWVRLFAGVSTRTPVERAMLYPAVGTMLGCWLGAIPIALDWDRPWQAWPLTPALGAVAGYILSSVAAVTANRFLADVRALNAGKSKL